MNVVLMSATQCCHDSLHASCPWTCAGVVGYATSECSSEGYCCVRSNWGFGLHFCIHACITNTCSKALRHLSISQAAGAGDVCAGVGRMQICLCLSGTLPYAPSWSTLTTSCTGDVGATAGLLLHLCAAAAAVPQYSLQLGFLGLNFRHRRPQDSL
jgi:hypothetical protein